MDQDVRAQAQQFYDSAFEKMRVEDNTGAIADCTEAIRLDPDFADAYILRGSARHELGTDEFPFDEPAVRADYEAAQRIDPLNANAYWGLGDCARERGQEHEALLLYRRYLELAGDSAVLTVRESVQRIEAAEAPPPPPRPSRFARLLKRLTRRSKDE